ncbi:DUF1365 domain-containing protein [Sneathiella limimaris]|uniref:DUF1365 domain-containing protein n=1 Tax=Sneathiella limimaris TaxID=1964213 RepID=UPI00146CCCC0|nr:DUF1365 domain-containing protein [Sneathiella limimaris]
MNSAIYSGTVVHRRLRPRGHLLKYKVFYLLIDLQELDEVGRICRWFSIDKKNVMSLFQKDFGSEKTEENSLFEAMKTLVLSELPGKEVRRIKLLSIPRLFGYAFNPISVFYSFDGNENLNAIVYEVRNTFGEKHHYIVSVEQDDPQLIVKHDCRKEMFVSPFIGMNCRYFFSINKPSDQLTLAIRQTEDDLPVLNASFSGNRLELTKKNLNRQLIAFPLNSVKVIAGIHWEALLLWLKKVPVIKHVRKSDLPTGLQAGK